LANVHINREIIHRQDEKMLFSLEESFDIFAIYFYELM